jgi:hypothetical protein
MSEAETIAREAGQDFIRDMIKSDLESGRHKAVVTRFPLSRTAISISATPNRSA